jgi:iron complex outermembrane receptor protein
VRLARPALAALIAGVATPCLGQTASDNAVRSAEDGFGTIVGNESLGIYGPDSVRGFSPTVAGNNRIEGLYADLVATPTGRIRSDANVRIGPAAQGFPFPSPTGIVDYTLKGRSKTRTTSADLYGDTFGGYGFTLDAELPIASLALTNAVGFGAARVRDSYGTTGKSLTYGIVSRAALTGSTELMGFVGGRQTFDQTSQPIYIADGTGAFPTAPRDRFLGPDWASNSTYNSLAGVAFNGVWSDWTMKAGVFRSEAGDSRSFENLVVENGPGSFQRLLIAYPRARAASVSGEARLSRAVKWGRLDQLITAMVRGRSNTSWFGGEQDIDLGTVDTIDTRPASAPVPLRYSGRSRSTIRQLTLGLDYNAKLGDAAELSVGLQRAPYSQQLDPADGPRSGFSENVWLPSASAGVTLTRSISLYGSFVRGLEDGGIAPGFAANGNQVLPAFRTRQWDAGVRLKPIANTTVIIGYFDIRKPYLTFDVDNVYRQIGDERHRGIETSATSQIGRHLVIVAGGVFGRPRVEAIPAAIAGIGTRPIGQSDTQLQLNFDYSIPSADSLSVDGALNYFSAQAASVNNQAITAAYATLDLGLRIHGKLSGTAYSLRVTASNITNAYVPLPVGDYVYVPFPRRNIGLDLILDL